MCIFKYSYAALCAMYLYNGCTYVGGCQRAFCWLLHRYMIYVLSVLSVCALQAHRNVPNLKVAELFFTMMVNNLLSKEDSIELISALSLSLYLSCFRLSCLDSMCLCLFSTYVCELSTHTKKKKVQVVQVWFQEFSSVSVARFEVPFSKKKTCFYLCVCVWCLCVCVCVCWHRNTCKVQGRILESSFFCPTVIIMGICRSLPVYPLPLMSTTIVFTARIFVLRLKCGKKILYSIVFTSINLEHFSYQ